MNYKTLIIALLMLPLFSCEEVIELDLNSASPKLVIEASIAEGKTATAKLSLSSNYFEPVKPKFVENAVVYVSVENGAKEQLTHIGNGLYQGALLKGIENNLYTIEIEYLGEKFLAQSFLHSKVAIDSLKTMPALSMPGMGSGKPAEGNVLKQSVLAMFKDNSEETNYYKLNYYRNDTLVTDFGGIFIYDDAFSNGLTMTAGAPRIEFKPGDISTLELLVIDKKAYIYFSTLSNILSSNPMNSSTPYNPESNFSNGALGYFMAYSADIKKMEIK